MLKFSDLRLSDIKKARRSMRHKLIWYMAAVAIFLALVLWAGLFLFGRLSSPRTETATALDVQMEVFRDDVRDLWRNVSVMGVHLSEDMTARLEKELARQGVSFSNLTGNISALNEVEAALLDSLCQHVRQTDCSGGFVILEASMRTDQAGVRCSGLYVQKSNAEHMTDDLLLYRGIASVGKANGIMPHRKWEQEFTIADFPNYDTLLAQAALPLNRACRTSDVITLPGTSERAILMTVPLIGANGTVYGLCGFSVNQTYFDAHHDQPSNLDRLACVMMTGGQELNVANGLITYPANGGFCYVPETTLTMRPMWGNGGVVTLSGEECQDTFQYVGVTETLTAVRGDENPLTLAVLIPREDYDNAVFGSIAQMLLLAVLLLVAVVACCLHAARHYLIPVYRDLELLQKEGRGGEEMTFLDFEPVSATLLAQDKAHEERVTTLEEARQAARRDAQRLAREKKEEIDPELFVYFKEGLETLTSAERRVYDAYVSGMNFPEIAATFTAAPSTLRSQTQRVYRKLGVNSVGALRRYADLLCQEESSETG